MNEGFQGFIRFPMKAHCHGANGRGRDGRTQPPPPAAGGALVHTVTQAARLSPSSLNQTVFLHLDLNLNSFFFLLLERRCLTFNHGFLH